MIRRVICIKKCFIKIVLVFMVIFPLAAASLCADESRSYIKAYYPDRPTVQMIIRSFEPAPPEVNYDEGYLVVHATADDITYLESEGFTTEAFPGYSIFNQKSAPNASRSKSTDSAYISKRYPCYGTVEETFAEARSIVANYPNLAELIDAGDSWQKENYGPGYDIWVLKLTSDVVSGDKPKLFITTAVHGREYATAPLSLAFANYLADNYSANADARWILDHHEVHLMLYANPDGRKMAETGILWRKNKNTNYCSYDEPGADLNRNFDFNWGGIGASSDTCNERYRGPYAASEPETQAVQNYMKSIFDDHNGNSPYTPVASDASGLYIDIHSYSELVMWPWGDTDTAAPNGTQLQTLGRKFAYFNGYTPKQIGSVFQSTGDTSPYAYGELGIASYGFELGTSFFQSCYIYENTILPDNLPALIYAAKVARTPYMTPAGPDVINLVTESATLSATVTDTRYNNSNGTEPTQTIAGAEYYIDIPPWSATATPIALTAADGSFDSDSEAVSATIDVSNLAPGEHIVYVRGKDADGNWGPVTAEFLTGSLKVTISPQGAVDAGAQWQADSGAWQDSGAVVPDLDGGSHTVTFKTIAGWTAPPDQAVNVSSGQTVSVTGTYTEIFHQTGSLKVTISPRSAADAGAQWQIDSGSWQNSETVVPNLDVGTHTVTFKTTDGWTAPPDQTVNVGSGQTVDSTGTYIPHPGSLKVMISPWYAADEGAQWQVDSGSWQNSGTVVPDLDGGTHTVTFKTIAGWTAPPDQTVTVSGQTVSVTGTYTENIQPPGSVKVTISPQGAVDAGAQWWVRSWQDSGTVATDLNVGTYTVTFKTTDGWTAPPDQTVNVSSGQTVSVTGTYTEIFHQTGSLKVTISPRNAANEGAQWQVDSGSWHNSETVVPNLDVGTHTVTFKATDGWTAPPDQTVDVSSGQTVDSTGTYVPHPNSLKVTILPRDAADAGAQWQIDGGSWQNSGTVVVPDGETYIVHTVTFKTTDGWTAPPDQTVKVSIRQTVNVTGTYAKIVQTGSLKVTISPQGAVDAGAQWQTDSGSWQDSGTVVSDLDVGTYTVFFKTADGWTAPPDQTVSISADVTEAISGTYTKETYTLADAIVILQMLCSVAPNNSEGYKDANSDGKAGFGDVAYILQSVLEVR